MSSLLESLSSQNENVKQFPLLLPQNTVALELGVIGTGPMTSQANNSSNDQDVHQLIDMCRRWRDLSRKSREKLNSDT